jgi:alpha-1,2-mannosyltransferase
MQRPGWVKAGRVLEVTPFIAALIVLPFVIPGGHFWPWKSNTMDLQVYVDAGRALLKGYDVVNLRFTDNSLAFIYPTFALLLAVPISWLPLGFLQVAFTLVSVLLLRILLRRFGVPAGLPIAVIGTVIVLLCQPVRATLGYGQVNVMVAAFVFIDLLPGRRLGPRGFLTGIAAGIKLTPALFGIYLLFLKRYKDAAWVFGVLFATIVVGFAFLPRESIEFWRLLVEGDTRTGAAYYLGNQSVLGGFVRLFHSYGEPGGVQYLALFVGAVTALIACVAGAGWTRRGEGLFGLSLVGLGTLMASPLSWTHHFVYVLPMVFALARRRVPNVLKWIGWPLFAWVFSGLVLQWLPYDQGRELHYGLFENLVSAITPALSVVFIVIAAFTFQQLPVIEPEGDIERDETTMVEPGRRLPQPAL